jgi:TonB family protein
MAPHKSASGPQATKPRTGVQSEDSTNPLDETPRNRQASVHTRSTTPPASEEALLDASANDTDAATITSRTLQVMLHEAFVAYFHYPSLARQNGWQGELRLGLRIEPNGELVRIRILTSSGYGILDRAAIRSLEAVRRLPHAAALLKGSSLDLILPVRYQLFDS